MRRSSSVIVAAIAVCVCFATFAFAQGGAGSMSTTGSISGKVLDPSGAAVRGVSVGVTSPALMGVQSTITDKGGVYVFPALPPGTYTVTCEQVGLKREGIDISIGFTAIVDLKVASAQETVTVTGSPVIDSRDTRVQSNFGIDALRDIPNARNLWSLIGLTPAVRMARIDVGGNLGTGGTQFTAYGSSQHRFLVEGINTTEGRGASAQSNLDYGAFQEVFIGTTAHSAEMPAAGVLSQVLTKSGGNRFDGELYQDYERNSFQGANIPSSVLSRGIREHSNESALRRDFNVDAGGPITKDKLWWYFSYRNQKTSRDQPNFIGPIAGTLSDVKLWNASGKATYQLNPNNKLIGYYHWAQGITPNALPIATSRYTDLAATVRETGKTWVYKAEWNGKLSNNIYAEARYGVFGYSNLTLANTDTTAPQIVNAQLAQVFNGGGKSQDVRQWRQASGALTYFTKGPGGWHNLKTGGDFFWYTGWSGILEAYSGNIRENIGSNGLPASVVFAAPTATQVGGIGDGSAGNLLYSSKINTTDAFISDQVTSGRVTLNLGLRFDHYLLLTPEQGQLAYTFPSGLSIPAQTFPETHYLTWNSVVPRLGLAYNLRGNGKTVVKLSYDRYTYNLGNGMVDSANPNAGQRTVTYAWTDTKVCPTCVPGDGLYQPGEEGALLSSTNVTNAMTIDPNMKQPGSWQATAHIEQEIAGGVAARVGFVYYLAHHHGFAIPAYQPLRPPSAYSLPFTFVDVGADNSRGTADDQTLTLYGIPNSAIAGCSPTVTTVTPTCQFPANTVLTDQQSQQSERYKTLEFSLTKRQSRNYSLGANFAYTWLHDFPANYPNTPNGPFDYDYSSANVHAYGTYGLPWGTRLIGVYRYQLGANYARTLSIPAAQTCLGGVPCTFSAAPGGVIYATPYDAYRQDNISVVDLRVRKTVRLNETNRLELFADVFNLTNQYAAEISNVATGPAFQNPTAILGPRTARIGFRYLW